MLLASADSLQVFQLLGGYRPAQAEREQIGVTADGVERGPQLVGHRRQKLTLCDVGRLRGGETAGVGNCSLLPSTALREITRDLRESQQRAVVVAYRGQDDVRPKGCAVFAEAVPFVLEAAV